MRAQIEQYLQSGYFAQGVALLRQYGRVPDRQLRQFDQYLSRSYVPADVENRLKQQLRIVLASLPKESPQSTLHSPQPAPTTARSPLKGFWAPFFQRQPSPPDAILRIRERTIAIHKEMSRIHPLMAAAAREGDKKTAYGYAEQRVNGQLQLDGLYESVREWEKTGQLPSTAKQSSTADDVMTKMKRVKYLNERICRIKKWRKEGQRKKRVKGEQVVVKINLLELQELEKEQLDRELEMKGLKEELGL